jgi:hypothetical protein
MYTFSQLNSNKNCHYNNNIRSNNIKNYQKPNPNNFNHKPIHRNFEYKKQCEHCHKYNHKSEECKWILICDFCNKRYHTSEICYSKNQLINQKPVNRFNAQTGKLHYSLTPEIKKNSNSRPITPKTTINSEINTISNKSLQTIKKHRYFQRSNSRFEKYN